MLFGVDVMLAQQLDQSSRVAYMSPIEGPSCEMRRRTLNHDIFVLADQPLLRVASEALAGVSRLCIRWYLLAIGRGRSIRDFLAAVLVRPIPSSPTWLLTRR